MAHWLETVVRIINSNTSDLKELASIAGYDPVTLYRGTNMDGLGLSEEIVKELGLDCSDYFRAADEIEYTSKEIKDLIVAGKSLPRRWLEKIKTFRASNRRMFDLSSLREAVNLQEVRVNDTYVNSVEPLKGCVDLRSLEIAGTRVKDLAPISECINLTRVDISRTGISNLKPLGGKKLKEISLSHLRIKDLSDLDLEDAFVVNLEYTDVSDVNFLRRSNNIAYLNISGTYIERFSGLNRKESLRTLHAANMKVEFSIESGSIPWVSNLNCRNTKMRKFEFLRKISGMASLDLENTGIGSVSPLADLHYCEVLNLARNPIDDISEWGVASSIRSLSLANTNVKDVSPLKSARTIGSLDISWSGVRNISFLSKSKIKILDISGCSADILSTIGDFDELRSVDVSSVSTSEKTDFAVPRGLKWIWVDPKNCEFFREKLVDTEVKIFIQSSFSGPQ